MTEADRLAAWKYVDGLRLVEDYAGELTDALGASLAGEWPEFPHVKEPGREVSVEVVRIADSEGRWLVDVVLSLLVPIYARRVRSDPETVESIEARSARNPGWSYDDTCDDDDLWMMEVVRGEPAVVRLELEVDGAGPCVEAFRVTSVRWVGYWAGGSHQ